MPYRTKFVIVDPPLVVNSSSFGLKGLSAEAEKKHPGKGVGERFFFQISPSWKVICSCWKA